MRLPLKFYTDLDFRQQNQVDTYSGDHQRYICTPFRLIPFQIRRDHSINAISEFKLVNVETLAETDLLAIGGVVEINYGATYDWLLYYGNSNFTAVIDIGSYYIVVNDTINTWYSDDIEICVGAYKNELYLASENTIQNVRTFSINEVGAISLIDTKAPVAEDCHDVWSNGQLLLCVFESSGLYSYGLAEGVMTFIDFDDRGDSYYACWFDGVFAYSGHRNNIDSYSVSAGNLTYVDSIAIPNNRICRTIWGDGDFLFAACEGEGLFCFSRDGAGNLTLHDTDFQGTQFYTGVHGNGEFIFVANQLDGLRCYSRDGAGNLTLHDTDYQAGGAGYNCVWSRGDYIYVGAGTRLHVYSVDGAGNLTYITFYGYDVWDIWGDDYRIYACTAMSIVIFSYSESNLILLSNTNIGGVIFPDPGIFVGVPDLTSELTLEWWNDCDICNILYQTGFQNKIYLNTDVFAPEYKFYEDAEEDDERNIIAYNQIAHKYYKFEIVGSEALCDAFSIIRMHDNIKLTFLNGSQYDLLDFTPDFDAIKDCYGTMQKIECTFRIGSCIKSACCNDETLYNKTLAGTGANGKILHSTDYGATWADLGQQGGETHILSLAYLESGIALAGTGANGKILRSTDYGATWADLGQQGGETYIRSLAYLESGIALAGTGDNGKILRSINHGVTWADLGQQFAQTHIFSLAYLRDGITLAGTGNNGKILRSTNYGATWADLGQQFGETSIRSLVYLENGIALAGTGNGGKILRSTDHGATWINLGQQGGETIIYFFAYCENGIVLAGTYGNGKILRSIDYGATWADLGQQFAQTYIYSLVYLENGIALAGTGNGGKILRSTDYGATWADLGQQGGETKIYSLAYP